MPFSACVVLSTTAKFFIFPWYLPLPNFRIERILKKPKRSSQALFLYRCLSLHAELLLKTCNLTWSSLPLSLGIFTCCRNVHRTDEATSSSSLSLFSLWPEDKRWFSEHFNIDRSSWFPSVDRVGLSMDETHRPSYISLTVYDCWPPEMQKLVPNARCWLSKKVHDLNGLFTVIVNHCFMKAGETKSFSSIVFLTSQMSKRSGKLINS